MEAIRFSENFCLLNQDTNTTKYFSFWGSASCCACFIKDIRKNRPSQQLFKEFIVFYTSPTTCFGPHWPSSSGAHNIIVWELCKNNNFFIYYIVCSAWWWPVRAETCIGRGIKYNKRLEQLLRRTGFPDNLDTTKYAYTRCIFTKILDTMRPSSLHSRTTCIQFPLYDRCERENIVTEVAPWLFWILRTLLWFGGGGGDAYISSILNVGSASI
jgi:hypothetical protein